MTTFGHCLLSCILCMQVDMSCSQFNDAIMTPRLDDSCYDFGEYDATYGKYGLNYVEIPLKILRKIVLFS